MFYPLASRPIWYGEYKLEMNIQMIRRSLVHTVVIANQNEQMLSFICYAIVLPLSFLFAFYVCYHILQVARMEHIYLFKLSFLCYATFELALMYLPAVAFASYYWIYGAYQYEYKHGTSLFVSLFYLYGQNYLPNYFFNLVNWSMVFMLIVYKKTKTSIVCCWKMSKYNIRAMYITGVTNVTVETMTIFSVTWVTEVNVGYDFRATRCFVLLNPVFDSLGIADHVRLIIWLIRIFLHTIPYIYSTFYLSMSMQIASVKYSYQEHRKGLFIAEREYYAGPIITLGICSIYLMIKMVWLLFDDLYVFYLYVIPTSTNSEFYFSVRAFETVFRTIYYVLGPFQLLALFSIHKNFQLTMVRYLNGTTIFDVDIKKTVGGDKKMKVIWKPLPEKLTWSARFYYEYLRCRPFALLFELYYRFTKRSQQEKRAAWRQRRAEKILKRENAMLREQRAKCPEIRIVIDPPEEEVFDEEDEMFESEVVFLNRIRDMEETAV